MASVSLDGLKTSIISQSLLTDVGADAFLPFVGSINTITQNTSNDGNVVTVSTTTLAPGNTATVEIPKYGYLSAIAIEFPTASANADGPSATSGAVGLQHNAYATVELCEIRSQGKKLLGWSGRGMSSMLQHYLSKSQYDAVVGLAGDGSKTNSVLVVPLPSFFDKKLALNTVMLDRMELVLRFVALDGSQPPNGAGKVHFWYHQVDPETEAMIRSELFKSGNRNLLMFDCQSYSVSTATSQNLTSQKLVRCHYVDEYITSGSTAYNYVRGSNVNAGNNALSQLVSVKAGGRVIYEAPKAMAVLNSVINGREVNNPRSLCVDYRNGIIKGASADYSSGLALRHLPNPTLSVSAFMTNNTTAADKLVVSEEAYVMVAIDANSGRISVVAEN